jgi:6-phosphogluconolactonase
MTTTKQIIYVGTYTQGKPTDGIYRYDFDAATGRLTLLRAADGTPDPSFLSLAPDRRCLLAVSEGVDYDGEAGGGVRAYGFDRETGELTPLNGQPTHGDHPCHVSFDHSGQWAFAANYTGGSLTMFPVYENGLIGAPSVVVRHHGRSIHPERQAGPHVHSAQVDPANRYLLVTDLGLDEIIAYPLDLPAGRLDSSTPSVTHAEPGAGPRHLCFHSNGRFVYVSNELNSTVAAYAYDSATGHLEALQTLSTRPAGYKPYNDAADIHLSPDARFLFVSNRGHDSLAGFAVDAESGLLTPLHHTPVEGHWPRNFGFDVTGRFVLVANQRSNTVTVFRFDAASGALAFTGEKIDVPEPSFVLAVAFES